MKKIEFNEGKSIFEDDLLSKKDLIKILGGTTFINYTCSGDSTTLKKSDYDDKCNGSSVKLGMSCSAGATLSAIIAGGSQSVGSENTSFDGLDTLI